MLKSQRHRLQNCFFEVEILEEDSQFTWQEKVAQLFQQKVLPKAEEVFNRIGSPDKMLQIDHLELDLGHVDTEHWQEDIEVALLTALEKAIVKRLHEQILLTDHVWASFIHFLRTGEEIGSLEHRRGKSWESVIIDLFNSKRAGELKLALSDANVRNRLVKQCSTPFWRKLLDMPSWEKLKLNIAPWLPKRWDYSNQAIFLQKLSEILDGEKSKAVTRQQKHPANSKNKNGYQLGQGHYIDNAGMVLLYPFFQPLFSSLGWLEGGDFTSLDEKNKAICLLEYLVSGREEVAESELVLPKLLCGWPNDVALNRFVELSENTKSEGEKVLLDVIEYWEVMQGTPVEGLREGFLQREGKLIRLPENQWKLKVARQTMDILLTSLPWGLSVVTLPWMNSMLFVEWK